MPKLRIRLIVTLILLIVLFASFNIFWFVAKREGKVNQKQVVKIEDLLDSSEILAKYSTDLSPDKQHYSFITTTDFGMRNQTIWISDLYGSQVFPVQEPENFKYYSSPVWSKNSKLAYIKYFPFEIYVYDPTSLQNELVFSQIDAKEEDSFFMQIGYFGKIDLEWDEQGENLSFYNTYKYPAQKYTVDTTTEKVTKEAIDRVDAIPPQDAGQAGQVRNDETEKIWGQRNSKWADEQLGACAEETIGSAGCAIASISMAFSKLGVDASPSEMNEFLSENEYQGYVNDCDVMWFIAQNYNPTLHLKGVYFGDFDFQRVIYELEQGNAVVVGFNRVNFSEVGHWVHVSGFDREKFDSAENDAERMEAFTVGDPWTEEEKDLSYFGGSFDSVVVFGSELVE